LLRKLTKKGGDKAWVTTKHCLARKRSHLPTLALFRTTVGKGEKTPAVSGSIHHIGAFQRVCEGVMQRGSLQKNLRRCFLPNFSGHRKNGRKNMSPGDIKLEENQRDQLCSRSATIHSGPLTGGGRRAGEYYSKIYSSGGGGKAWT